MAKIKNELLSQFNILLQIVSKGIEMFQEQDYYLLEINASERCLCGRLAHHLQKSIDESEYHEYYVDPEYNRGFAKDDTLVKELDDRKLLLDIVIHKRKYHCGYQNLVCIEMKKEKQKEEEKDKDRIRLKKLTQLGYGFDYQLGVFIVAESNRLKVKNVYSSFSCEYDSEIDKEYWENVFEKG